MRDVGPDQFRSVMGHFATGVTVVTANTPDGPVGMTANAVSSLSLEPLLLLVAFDNDARTLRVVRETGRFGVNVLAAGQEDLARLFASKTPEREKFAGVAAHGARRHPGDRGRARLGRLPARAADPGRRSHDRDRRRRGGRGRAAGEPLIWYRGEYRT